MSAIERLLQFIEYKGDTKYKFYKKTGLSNGFLDKNRNIGSDKCEIISVEYPDLSLEWLLTGKGSMLKSEVLPVQEITPTNNEKYIALLEAQLKDKEEIIAFQKEKIKELEQRLKDAELQDIEAMATKIARQRKEINALKSSNTGTSRPAISPTGL